MLLPGETTPLQGKLAVLARSNDKEMRELFSSIDTRTRCLYLGLDLPDEPADTKYIHYPVITTVPCNPDTPDIVRCFSKVPAYTHIIFTSKNAVRIFFLFLAHYPHSLDHLTMIAVGEKTAETLKQQGITNIVVAANETAEGITEMLDNMDLKNAFVFWPHSSLSRPVISLYLEACDIEFNECTIYRTQSFRPRALPPPDSYDAVFFTSPSTIDAFIQIAGKLPHDKELRSIGPVTKEALELNQILHYKNH
jgi:hydroxymethylbilane synthase